MSGVARLKEEPILARAPQAAAYVRLLAAGPRQRPKGRSHAALFARRLGLIDDEVIGPGGRRMAAQDAKDKLGPDWHLHVQFTQRELLTPAGRAELARLRKSD
jgi:hypothetical protein